MRPGTGLDAEAERRGNSVYVPGAVEPMLPRALSNEACSLVPGLPRPTVTVEMHLTADAQVRSTSFYRSTIRSDARLIYYEVDDVFAGRTRAPQVIAGPLALAREVAAALRRKRLARGALAVESSEPEFEFDDRGNVVAARDEVQTESHWVIEHLMILANEQVAEHLAAARIGTIYRVHEQPDPASVERLVAQLASLDVPTPPLPERMSPQEAGGIRGRDQRARPRIPAGHGPRWTGARLARAALAQAGDLLAQQHRPRGPREQRVLPFHLADPPLSGPGGPPRPAVHPGLRRRLPQR